MLPQTESMVHDAGRHFFEVLVHFKYKCLPAFLLKKDALCGRITFIIVTFYSVSMESVESFLKCQYKNQRLLKTDEIYTHRLIHV